MSDRQTPRRPGPIGGDMAAIVFGLARRAHLASLIERYDSTTVMGLFAFVNGLIAIGAMALVALVTGEPFVFRRSGPPRSCCSTRPCCRRRRPATRWAATRSGPPPATCRSSCSG